MLRLFVCLRVLWGEGYCLSAVPCTVKVSIQTNSTNTHIFSSPFMSNTLTTPPCLSLTPSHARFLAAVRIVSFLSALSCKYVCCYCILGGGGITMLEAWQLLMRFIYWRLFIYSIYSSCILCDWHLFGRPSFAQSCFGAGLLSIHYKNGKQAGRGFQLEFHWRKFIVGFTPVWWESSS